jgi:hypothetical protein
MVRTTRLAFGVLSVVAAFFAFLSEADAAEGGASPYLKGYRDTLIGVVPPEAGLYARNDFIYYDAEASRTVLGGRVQLALEPQYIVDALSLTWVTDKKVLGGQYAFGVAPSLMWQSIDARVNTSVGSLSRGDDEFNLGDTFVTPIVLGWHGARNTHWNAGLSIALPTGKYDEDDLANTSLNVYALIPQAGFTYFDPRSGWDASIGLAYAISFQNEATDYDSGDIVHLDMSLTKGFGKWRVGAVGYTMNQVTDDSGSGALLGAFKSEVYGAGILAAYGADVAGKPVNLTIKWSGEFDADNTFEGSTVTLAGSLKF